MTMTAECSSYVPRWWDELRRQSAQGVAHAFCLHGEIADYAKPAVEVSRFLDASMSRLDLVVRYSRARGVYFGDAGQRSDAWAQLFLKASGLDAATTNPAIRGLAVRSPLDQLNGMTSPSAAIPMIDRVLNSGVQVEEAPADAHNPAVMRPARMAVIVEAADTVSPAGEMISLSGDDRTVLVALQRWASRDYARKGCLVILMSESLEAIHPSLRTGGAALYPVRIERPNEEERLLWARYHAEQSAISDGVGCEMPVSVLARMTAGLLRCHIEDLFLRARKEGQPVTEAFVRERKASIIAAEFGETIETWEPEHGFEVIGGQEHVKQWFTRAVINPIRSGSTSRCPKGVLLLGPPGTGKSLLAKALAKEAGVNALRFDPSRVFGKWVGDSERNLRRVLECLQSMTPCVVFIDEIDQQAGGRSESGDGGVGGRVFGMLLEFMAREEFRGRIIWIAASNRPDLVDAAMLRPGRFDRKVPMLPPDEAERVQILRVLARRFRVNADDLTLEVTAAATEGWTGAELEAITLKAAESMEWYGSTPADAYPDALECYRATTGDIARQVSLALQHCDDLSLMPPRYREMLKARDAAPAVPAPDPAPASPTTRSGFDL